MNMDTDVHPDLINSRFADVSISRAAQARNLILIPRLRLRRVRPRGYQVFSPIDGTNDCSGSLGIAWFTTVARTVRSTTRQVSRATGENHMRATIMVTDIILRFRLAAIEQSLQQAQTWELEVMTIQEVARILVSLGFLDPEAAARLTEASTTITPQLGVTTVSLTDIVPLMEVLYPEDEPASLEAQQTYILVTQGETTEEALAAAGFVLIVDGPLQ